MSKIILKEELNRMKSLFDYERGVVISEQKYESPDWKGRSKGNLDFKNPYGKYAVNVGYEDGKYTLTSMTSIPKILKQEIEPTSGETVTTGETINPLKLIGNSFPYPDNMIGPKFGNFPDAKNEFNSFILKLGKFIKSGGVDKIKSLSIQGTADSARPTLDIPKGYSSLDHNLVGDSSPYGGEKNDSKRNLYLANNRAKVIGDMIINQIKESTGFDLSDKIVYLDGVNYYGQPDKRGSEFKQVIVTPSYETLNLKTPLPSSITSTPPNERGEKSTQSSDGFLDLTKYGSKKIPVKLINVNNKNIIGVLREISNENNLLNMKEGGILPLWTSEGLNRKNNVKGEIRNDELYVDNISFGKINFINPDEISTDYNNKAESSTRYITDGRPVIWGGNEQYDYIKILKFSFSEL